MLVIPAWEGGAKHSALDLVNDEGGEGPGLGVDGAILAVAAPVGGGGHCLSSPGPWHCSSSTHFQRVTAR